MKIRSKEDLKRPLTLMQANIENLRNCSVSCRARGLRSWDMWSCQTLCASGLEKPEEIRVEKSEGD